MPQSDFSASPVTVTVVLTPGRSGSSLLVETLDHLGMNLSTELISGRSENARGFFEDSDIVAVHKNLLQELNTRSYVPLPEGWLATNAAKEAQRLLEQIVSEKTASELNWVFKDPRTTVLLPLWERVFNRVGVVPRYIFAIRHPSSVSASLRRIGNLDAHQSEAMWLVRTTEALHHTAAAGFLVHYEDWFDHPEETARGLARWCGLEPPSEEVLEKITSLVLVDNLNHSLLKELEISNPSAERLYSVLRDCKGEIFQRRRVLAEVEESRRFIQAFRVWGAPGHNAHDGAGGHSEGSATVKSSVPGKSDDSDALQESQDWKGASFTQVEKYHRALREMKKLEDETHELRVRLLVKSQEPTKPPIGAAKRTASPSKKVKSNEPSGNPERRKQSSIRYRIGDTIVSAIISPGKNTVKLPFRLYRLLREGWNLRQRTRQKLKAS